MSIILIIILLSISTICLLYTTYNLLKKNEKLEDIVDKQDLYINNISEIINASSNRLNEIDERGIFEADDEIGWFFKEIKKINVMLENFILEENKEYDKKNKKEKRT